MKSVFIMINSLGMGGAEKSLISFLNTIDLSKYHIYLQTINCGGALKSLIPNEVELLPEIPFFAFCRKSNLQQLTNGSLKYLLARIKLSLSLKNNNKKGHPLHDTQAYWRGAQTAFDIMEDVFDVAIAWGQGTPTHYVAEKVHANKKIAWVNADYEAVGHNAAFDYKIYGEFNNIIGVSERLSEKMRMIYPDYVDRISTIYDINNAALIESMAREIVRDAYKPGLLNLCTVGRLVKPKGYDLVLDAAERLMSKGIDFRWNIIGEGPERSLLEEGIISRNLQGKVCLLGTKMNPYPYIKASDIYVQTSRSEGFCLTLTEARILHKRCVSTCFDMVYDQIINEHNGLIVAMEGNAIADGIIRMSSDSMLSNTIQDNLATEMNSNETEITKFYQLLEGWNHK